MDATDIHNLFNNSKELQKYVLKDFVTDEPDGRPGVNTTVRSSLIVKHLLVNSCNGVKDFLYLEVVCKEQLVEIGVMIKLLLFKTVPIL